jgi:UDP-glucose 4-epimerase
MVPEGIEYIEGNLGDRDLIEKLFRSGKAEGRPFEAVLHFAALIEAGESMKRPEIYFRNKSRLIFNLGNGHGFSVREVIESARRITGHAIPAEIHPRRFGDPAVLVAGSEKAIRELGWKPRYTQLDDIIRTAWIWHQKRYKA